VIEIQGVELTVEPPPGDDPYALLGLLLSHRVEFDDDVRPLLVSTT